MPKRLKLRGGFKETKEDFAGRIRSKKLVIENPKKRKKAPVKKSKK
jgi:hypothetical protein